MAFECRLLCVVRLSIFGRFVFLESAISIRFVWDFSEIWICGLYRQESLPTDFEIPDTDDVQSGIEGEDSFSTTDVQRIMDLLSIDNRILFGLYLQGYRYDEIADRLQMPLGTVKVRIYRIKQELRTYKKQLV